MSLTFMRVFPNNNKTTILTQILSSYQWHGGAVGWASDFRFIGRGFKSCLRAYRDPISTLNGTSLLTLYYSKIKFSAF